ncbi:2993_t:CDS:2, partial [Diversispora eburnea]
LINTRETLRVVETWNIDNESNLEDSDKNSQDSYTPNTDMITISDLSKAIDGYLDNPRTDKRILQNRYNVKTEQDLRQTDLNNVLNDLNLMTMAYNNERNTRQQYFLELQQCRIKIEQENPEEYYERILHVFEYTEPVIASANANINNTFVDANKCDVLKTKMAEKYTPVLANDPYTTLNSAIVTLTTFLVWLKGKYSTETVGSKQMAKRFLSQEQFNSTDTPDIYRKRIRPYLTYIPYADLLPYIYDHLPKNIEVRMRINPPADINAFFISFITIYRELNQKQAFQVRQNKKHQQNDNIISQPIVPQPASSSLDMEKRFQDELAKRDVKYEAEMEKLRKEVQSSKAQKTQIPVLQTIEPVRQLRSSLSNLKIEEDYKNYYIAKYFNDLGIYSKDNLDSNYPEKPFQRPRTQQKVNSTRLEEKVDEIVNIVSANEGGYDEEKDI